MSIQRTTFALTLSVLAFACSPVEDSEPSFDAGPSVADGGTQPFQTCEVSADCAAECGAFGECMGFADTCSEMGTRTVECTEMECVAGACEAAETFEETVACTRDTAGTVCGESEFSCGGCGEFESTCDEVGIKLCTQVDYSCAAGACEAQTTNTEEGCLRSTDGNSCGSTTVVCGSCQFESACDETGSKVCQTTLFDCGNGDCGSTTVGTTISCSRNTDGATCGITACGNGLNIGTKELCCSAGSCTSSCGPCE